MTQRFGATGRSTLVALVALLMVSVLLPAVTSPASAASQDFSGTADANNASLRWQTFDVNVSASGQLTATLAWSNAAADLTLFVRDPNGNLVDMDGSTANPKVISRSVAAGAWRVHVKARGGSSPFTLTVDTPDGGGGTPPAGELTFSGSGSAAGPSWFSHDVDITASGDMRVDLSWPTSSADLSLFVRNPAGNLVAFEGSSANPKTIIQPVTPGRWRVHAKVRAGSTSYNVTVNPPGTDGGGGGGATGSLGDRVWSDTNGDGIQDAAEPGLAGVALALLDGNGNQVATATSSATGGYSFTGLAAGTYRVRVSSLPAGTSLSPRDAGANDTVDSDIDPASRTSGAVTVAEGASIANLDVGVVPAAGGGDADVTFNGSGSAAGPSWLSHDLPITGSGDVTLDLDWVTASADLTLFLRNPAGTIVAFNGSTDKPKSITHPVTPGVWRVHVKVRGGSSAYTVDVTLPTGPSIQQGTIAGRVFNDADGDGIQDGGESGLGGLTVEALDSAGTTLASTSTASDGTYSVSVPPGDSRIRVSGIAEGASFSPLDAGGNDALDSDVATDGRSALVAVAEGATVTLDAGVVPAPVTGDFDATFDGQASLANRWQTFDVPVSQAGSLDAVLEWVDATAVLQLYLRNPAGTIVASDAGGTTKPRRITQAVTPGTWKLHVRTASGASDFTLGVNFPNDGGVNPGDGNGIAAYRTRFGYNGPAGLYAYGVAFDKASGSIMVADLWNYRVRKFSRTGAPQGSVSQVAPKGEQGGIGSPFDIDTDARGNTWVADQSGARVVQFSPNGTWLRTIGWGGGPAPAHTQPRLGCSGADMTRPTNLEIVDSLNRIYVADTLCRDIKVYNLQGEFLFAFNLRDKLPVGQPIPRGLEQGPNGNIYVVEFQTRRIHEFTPNGAFVRSLPRFDNMSDPRGLAIDENNGLIYVADAAGEELFVFRLGDGSLVRRVTGVGGEDFVSIRYVDVDDQGFVYVADTWAYTVYKLDAAGNRHPFAAEDLTPPDGGFNQPNGIGIDPATGKLYVADSFENRVQVFDTRNPDGTLSRCTSRVDCPAYDFHFGNRGQPGPQEIDAFNYPRGVEFANGKLFIGPGGGILRTDPAGNAEYRFGNLGPTQNEFGGLNVFGIAISGAPGSETIWTMENNRCRLQGWRNKQGVRYDFNGELVTIMSTCGRGDNQMLNPRDLVYHQGFLYVADAGNNRIAVWNASTGQLVREISAPVAGVRLRGPEGVTIDAGGNWVYVADSANQRIVRYRLDGSGGQLVADSSLIPGASFKEPEFLEFDNRGVLFVSDNSRSVYAFEIVG